ncbi:hypothetical protein L5515_007996 [Caenorhabditis briggsae]|uniref:glucuronosyltransferase n=1 Tax=Caenorhabditis briggsae TaxID=6238 RepID=A0AAE9F6Q0_CAEBR|nr:hypothetical protein L5515_007996 [Caenorhabditis briggsae]
MTIKMVRKDNIKVQKVIELIEMHLNLLFFSILSSFPVFTFSYNYLVFCPLFAHSHHKFLAKIADTLTDAGHNVTFLAPIIVKEYEHIKYLETTKDIIYIQPDESLKQIGDSADYASFWKDDFGMFSMLPAIEKFYKMFSGVVENLRRDPTILDELKTRNFDAMIFESLAICAHPIHEYLGIKTIFPSFSMTHMTELSKSIGEPVSPSFLPISVSPFGDQMTFKERLLNTLGDFTFTHIFKPPVLKSLKYPYNDLDINEIQSKAPFVFFNSNPFLDFPRPTLTKTIAIGGISVNVTQMRLEKLSSEYDQIMSQRKKNVLISFGSMLRSCEMPDEYKNMIIRVVEQHPEATFIWKYESEDLDFAKNFMAVQIQRFDDRIPPVNMIFYRILIHLFLLIPIVPSAKFLVYCPLFAHSHHTFLAKIADTLSEAGHNVTFLAPIIVEGYENIKYWKHTTDIIYIQPDEKLKELGKVIKSVEFTKYWTEELTVFSMISSIKLFQKMFFKIYENFKKDLRVLDSLKTRKFDAIIYEVFAFNAIAIQEYLDIRTLYPAFSVTHSSSLSNSIGEPSSPATLSGSLSPFGDKMTFEERLMNTLCSFIYGVLLRPPTMSSYKSPYHTIDLNEAESRAPFVFLNSNPYLDFPRPTLTKTVQIGGITVNRTQMKQEKLPLEFDKILEIRQKTVLISFGTIMLSKDTPEDYK